MPNAIPNVYRVKGTFSYLEFCHSYDSKSTECPSQLECEGHEKLKTIERQVEALSEHDAAKQCLDDYDEHNGYPQASWLFGQPSIEYLRSSVDVAGFWSVASRQKEAMLKRLRAK